MTPVKSFDSCWEWRTGRILGAKTRKAEDRVTETVVDASQNVFPELKILALLVGFAAASTEPFEEVFSWGEVDFNFTEQNVRDAYIASGDFIRSNNLPLGMDIWGDKMFITIPRWKKGVPSNLNYISLSKNVDEKSPLLTPYPNWETNDIHRTPNTTIVSIFRIAIDSCDRLWGVDSGFDDILGDGSVVAPVQIVVIDLKTDQVIRRYPLKETDQKAESFFANIVVDVESQSCEDAYAYIPDLGGYGLVVYSWSQNDSWRVNHNFFAFDPLHGDFNVGGVNFQWTDGVFGLALTPLQNDGYKTLYFHAMASTTEFSVSTGVLRNQSLATSGENYFYFHEVGDRGPLSQASTSVLDPDTGVIFFGQVNRDGIGCWNTKNKLTPETFHLLCQDHESLVFPNDVKIDQSTRNIYVLTDKLPVFQYSSLDATKTNYRILRSSISDAASRCP